ncbi:MAG: hypothetical protein WBW69_00250, partial [Candidatus Korobacteraceae bacterium]
MASPISRRVPQLSAPSRPSALRYAILACLFVATTCLFVQSTKTTLHQAPINAPIFVPQNYSPIVYLVDAKAAAAGLHRGDILVAINHHPYTGMAVFWEALRKATPGSVLLVTVRSPQPNSPDRTIAFPVTARTLVIDSKPARISLRIVVPAFCFVLGFWVVMVRPRDLSAWLLLGLLLGLGETVSGYPAFDDWGPAALKVVYTYYLL